MFDRKIKIALVLSSLLSIVACSDYLDEFQNEYEDSFVALDIPVSSEEALSSEEGKSSDKEMSSSSQEDDSGNSSANSSASENSSDRDDSSSSVNSSDSSTSSSSVNSSDSGNSSSSVNSSGSGDSSSSVNSSSSVPSFGTCAPSISTVTTNSTVMWLFSWNDADTTLAAIEKVMASYKWLSEGGSPASGTSGTFSTSYASSGMKTASVEVTVRSIGTQVIECSTLQVTSGADETSTVQCQSGDMWCKNESYRVNTGINAGLDNGGQWWAKTDVIEPSPGASKLNWTPALDTDSSFNSVIDHCNGLCGTYTLRKGSLETSNPYVKVGFSVAGQFAAAFDDVPADASSWDGICVTYTLDNGARLELYPDSVTEHVGLKYDVPFVSLDKQSEAEEKCFDWSEFIQEGWAIHQGALRFSGVEAAKYVKSIGFKIVGSNGSTGSFNIIRIRKKNASGVAKLSAWSYLNPNMTYGLVRDSRDGHLYKTVDIGEQTWMAQNLNYEPLNDTASYCYGGDTKNCNTYGRLYTWSVAKDVCPDGWHTPLQWEIGKLITSAGGQASAANNLMAKMGWTQFGNPTDNRGFSALPAGMFDSGSSRYNGIDEFAGFWSSTDGYGIAIDGECMNNNFCIGSSNKNYAYSVRCIKGNVAYNPTANTLTDFRDNKTYKTVKIGNQVWMAENLNYAYNESSSDRASRSTCYENDQANCEIYGRLYGGTAAMKVCPDGWRLPLMSDFETLIETAGGDTSVVGTILKTDTGWDNVQVVGTDDLGFSALPAGIWNKKVGEFSWLRGDAHFWTSEALNSSSATYGFYLNTKKGIGQESYSTDFMFSVRCLKND